MQYDWLHHCNKNFLGYLNLLYTVVFWLPTPIVKNLSTVQLEIISMYTQIC